MKTDKKLKVFVAQSFDKPPPSWSAVSDEKVSQWFEKLMKNLGWTVVTGKKLRAAPIKEKISGDVNTSQAVIGIFTGKIAIAERRLPSAWVLCECAYAMGRFEGSDYLVAGFREKGLDPKELALLTVDGMEFPEFERDKLDENKAKFVEYLKSIEEKIRYGSDELVLTSPKLPFKQAVLRKIFLIYRNGYCTVQNINEFVIHDPERFFSEFSGTIKHRIWNNKIQFPPLAEMRNTPIYQRKQKPFFYANLDYHRNLKLDIPLEVKKEEQEEDSISFCPKFPDTYKDAKGKETRLKPHDSLGYQYAYGLPNMYPIIEDELSPVVGEEINPDTYCFAEVEANHGEIENLIIELRFERDSRGIKRNELFSKAPGYQIGHGYTNVEWSPVRQVPRAKDETAEYNIWYEIYQLQLKSFNGKLRIIWRPSSKKTQSYL